YKELVPNAPINVLPERIAEIAEDKNTYLIVCEASKSIIATALVTLCNDAMFTRQPFAVIENVIVSESCRSKGVGRDLMNHIEAFCLAVNCSKIMLLSSSDNKKAHNFYASIGYDPDTKSGFIKKRRHFSNQEKILCDLPAQE
ncbi:MAG: GNAT family N-acetyltransferase, partial [Moraxellaceae bacterium]